MKNTSMVYISSLRDKIFTKSVFLTMAVALVVGGFFVANSVLAAGPVFIDTNVNGILDLGEDSFDTIQAAIDASSIIMAVPDTIVLSSDITISSAVNVDRAVTINGAGYHLNANFTKTSNSNNAAIHIIYPDVTIKNLIIDGTEGGQVWNLQLHGINVYQSEGINLDTVSILNFGGAGIIVNGSTVTATNLNTSNNIWGAVNVDPGDGVTTASVFTLNSGNLAEDNQIWSDGAYISGSATVKVNAEGEDYSEYKLAGTEAYFVWTNRALTNVATINSDPATLYTSIQAAINAASDGDTINVAEGTYEEAVVVYKPLTIKSSGSVANTIIDVPVSQTPGDQTDRFGFIVVTSGVTIDGFTINNATVDAGANTTNDANRGVGILVGTKDTTYFGYVPGNKDESCGGTQLTKYSAEWYSFPYWKCGNVPVADGKTSGFNNNVIQNNIINSPSNGIVVSDSDSVTIKDNIFNSPVKS